MALTFNPATLVIDASASIPDLPAFHSELRDWEDSEGAAIHPVTHKYKRVDLGGGAFFHAVDLINGLRLRFPVSGNYTITGNLGAEIIPAPGVFVERKTSAAFATSSSSVAVSALTPEQAGQLAALAALLPQVKQDTGLIPALL
jgi:hypothetical protein